MSAFHPNQTFALTVRKRPNADIVSPSQSLDPLCQVARQKFERFDIQQLAGDGSPVPSQFALQLGLRAQGFGDCGGLRIRKVEVAICGEAQCRKCAGQPTIAAALTDGRLDVVWNDLTDLLPILARNGSRLTVL